MTDQINYAEAIPLTEMRDVRTQYEDVPVFHPKVGVIWRKKVITLWRDREGRQMGSWRWED
jgi:hypothetical protein